jgi:hypothetical protein
MVNFSLHGGGGARSDETVLREARRVGQLRTAKRPPALGPAGVCPSQAMEKGVL